MPTKYPASFNARQLFADWLSHGLIDQEHHARLEQFVTNRDHGTELPLYLRALVGVGALIALLCFIGFLTVAGLVNFESEPGLAFWGLVFIAGAVLLDVASGGDDNTVRDSFFMQASFCFMATGKILLVSAIALLFKPNVEWGIAVGALLVTAATYFVYRMSIDRFLSSLAVLVSVFVNLLLTRTFDIGTQTLLLNAFFVAQLGMAAVLMTHGKIRQAFIPIAYALIASLCIEVLFFSMQSQIGYWGYSYNFSPVITNISLTMALIALIGWAAGDMGKLRSEALAVAVLGALCLGAISAPGILLAVGLMTLGHAKHDRLLLVSGGLLIPVFLFLYYYNLDLTLMAKSGTLVASGAVLLAGRAYVHFRHFDREI